MSLLATLLGLLAPFHGLQADDWPRWRGAHFDDAARAEDVFARPFELVVRWRVPIGSGYSGISLRGETAVTLAADDGSDWVLALDAESGAERWRVRIGPAFPGVDGAADGPVSTPSIGRDAVYALGPRGELLALALDTGKERWKVDLAAAHGAPQPHWGFTTAPLLVGDLLVVAAGAPDERAFLAFDAVTGAPRWAAGTDAIHYQSPILAELAGEELVVGAGNSFLFGLEPATGALRWRVKHGGAEFYQQILQPLALGDDELLLKHQRGLSARVRVGAGEIEELWRSRHLRGNYNLAVHHDGLLFGHGGTFLSCVDAGSGELLWRSRPPGDGWIVLVDGHLVVLTKAGTLHVAPASPDGYEERASLALLEHLTWTPPSFAGGRVLARDSLRDAACVEIVPMEAREGPLAARADAAPVPALFAELAARVAASDDPNEVVDEFLASQARFPLVMDDGRTVHFVFRGPAQDLVVRGDFGADEDVLAMLRVPGTDLFHATVELAEDARIGYQLVRDLDEALADPLNPATTPSLTLLGPVSALVMPRAEAPAAPAPAVSTGATAAGTRETFTLDVPVSNREGRAWGGPRRVWVPLPPGYAESERRYPVLLVNDGASALEVIGLPALLDALSGKAMEPVIAVFVELQGSYELARAEQDLYRDLLVERIVPEIDARFRTRARADARAVLGWDEGAYAALFAGLTRPDVLGLAAAQSLYHGSSQGQRVLTELVAAAEALPAVHLDWGDYDARDPKRAQDMPACNRELAAALAARSAKVVTHTARDGDQVAFWRARLPALLAGLFPARE